MGLCISSGMYKGVMNISRIGKERVEYHITSVQSKALRNNAKSHLNFTSIQGNMRHEGGHCREIEIVWSALVEECANCFIGFVQILRKVNEKLRIALLW